MAPFYADYFLTSGVDGTQNKQSAFCGWVTQHKRTIYRNGGSIKIVTMREKVTCSSPWQEVFFLAVDVVDLGVSRMSFGSTRR